MAASFLSCVSQSGAKLTDQEQARVYLQKGDAKNAIPLLERLFKESPDDLSVARSLAEAHVKAGSADLLLKRLETSDAPTSHYIRGLVLFSKASDANQPAIAELKRAVDLAPNTAEFHFRLGIAQLESEKYEAALPSLQRAIELDPKQLSWNLPLAKVFYRIGEQPKATAALKSVVSETPSAADVKTARALMDQMTDPFATVPQAVKPAMEQGLYWLQVADVPQQAIVAFETIARDYPDLAVIHAMLGLSYLRLDDLGRAVDELKRAIELNPKDGKAHLYLGQLYASHQRAKQAQGEFEKALELNPLLESAHAHLGDMALQQNDLPAAAQHLHVATLLAPENATFRAQLAVVYQKQGNWPAADRALHSVIDREPENLEFQLRLGLLHAEHFNLAKTSEEKHAAKVEATRWLSKVLEKQPENALASQAFETVNVR